MKNIKVELLHFTPSNVIVEAVGLPHKLEKPTIEIATKVIAKLHHTSVSEHCTMNFKIEGISRLCMQEHARHRITSTTASSSRYTLFKLLNEFGSIKEICDHWEIETEPIISDNFVKPVRPDYITDDNDWSSFITTLKTTNRTCLSDTEHYKKLGFKSDVLKYLLGENFRISLVWTINLRSLINFLSLRLDEAAHFEIRYLAGLIKSQACRVPYIRNILEKIDDIVTIEDVLALLKELREVHENHHIDTRLIDTIQKFIEE